MSRDRPLDRPERTIERERSIPLPPERWKTLVDTGKFHVVDSREFDQKDLLALARKNLLHSYKLTNQLSVTCLTRYGKAWVRHHPENQGQTFYDDRDSSRYPAHDSKLYAIYKTERERLESQGYRITRIVLERELASKWYSARRQVALETGEDPLRFEKTPLNIPDLRLEVEDELGRKSNVDIEYVTPIYNYTKISSGLASGFRIYTVGKTYDRVCRIADRHYPLAEVFRL